MVKKDQGIHQAGGLATSSIAGRLVRSSPRVCTAPRNGGGCYNYTSLEHPGVLFTRSAPLFCARLQHNGRQLAQKGGKQGLRGGALSSVWAIAAHS